MIKKSTRKGFLASGLLDVWAMLFFATVAVVFIMLFSSLSTDKNAMEREHAVLFAESDYVLITFLKHPVTIDSTEMTYSQALARLKQEDNSFERELTQQITNYLRNLNSNDPTVYWTIQIENYGDTSLKKFAVLEGGLLVSTSLVDEKKQKLMLPDGSAMYFYMYPGNTPPLFEENIILGP